MTDALSRALDKAFKNLENAPKKAVHKATHSGSGTPWVACNGQELEYRYEKGVANRICYDPSNRYEFSHFWRDVTCKKCLALAKKVPARTRIKRYWEK